MRHYKRSKACVKAVLDATSNSSQAASVSLTRQYMALSSGFSRSTCLTCRRCRSRRSGRRAGTSRRHPSMMLYVLAASRSWVANCWSDRTTCRSVPARAAAAIKTESTRTSSPRRATERASAAPAWASARGATRPAGERTLAGAVATMRNGPWPRRRGCSSSSATRASAGSRAGLFPHHGYVHGNRCSARPYGLSDRCGRMPP